MVYKSRQRSLHKSRHYKSLQWVVYKSRQRLEQITAVTGTNHGSGWNKSRHRCYKSRHNLLQSRLIVLVRWRFWAEFGSLVSGCGRSGSVRYGFRGRNTNHGIPRQITAASTPNHDIDFGPFAPIRLICFFDFCFCECPFISRLPSLAVSPAAPVLYLFSPLPASLLPFPPL